MTDEDVVRRCHEITGIGRVHGPYLPSYPGGKPYWGWSVQSARDAYLLMRELYPLLGERRRRQVIDKALPWMLYRPQPRNRNRARTADGRLA